MRNYFLVPLTAVVFLFRLDVLEDRFRVPLTAVVFLVRVPDLEFFMIRQKDRLGPDAHLHGAVHDDLGFEGQPVLRFVVTLRFVVALVLAAESVLRDCLSLKDFCRRDAAALSVFARPGPSV